MRLEHSRTSSCRTASSNRLTNRGLEMKRLNQWAITIALVAALPLPGCGDADKTAHHMIHPATVEPSEDSGISRLSLTEKAVERLGIELAEVTSEGGMQIAPYGALLYDANGGTWVYTSPQQNVFKRASMIVDRIDGDKLYMTSGPATGTEVVIVGAAELHGAEFEIGH